VQEMRIKIDKELNWHCFRYRRQKQAEKALQWFYSKCPELATKEWQTLTLEVTKSQSGPKPTFSQRLRRFFHPSVMKALGVLFGYFVFQQLSGIYILLFYTVDLLQRTESSMDPFTATILVGVMRMLTSIAAVMASRPVGRRPLSIFSGMGMAVTTLIAGTCLYFMTDGDPVVGWISLVCILLYMIFAGVGFQCLPWTMCSELLPLHARGIGGGICNTVNHFFMFSVLKAYPFAADFLQGFGILWCFGTASFLGCVFVYFFLPETMGKSLLEIEEHFASKPKERKNIYTVCSNIEDKNPA
jgi:facilitated trehalose transporter